MAVYHLSLFVSSSVFIHIVYIYIIHCAYKQQQQQLFKSMKYSSVPHMVVCRQYRDISQIRSVDTVCVFEEEKLIFEKKSFLVGEREDRDAV